MKSTRKRQIPLASVPCFECDGGTPRPVFQDHPAVHPELGKVTVPAVPMLRCDSCGAIIIGDEGNKRIDIYLEKALNAISPQEIQAFLDKYQLTQKRAAELTGYGEKNLSRWLSGRARPSESVSNFLRVLLAEERAFERLRTRNFEVHGRVPPATGEQRPDQEELAIVKLVDYPCLVRIGAAAPTSSPIARRNELCRLLQMPDLRSIGPGAEMDAHLAANLVNGTIWTELGCRAAEKVDVKPYDRDHLKQAVGKLRELTRFPLVEIVPELRRTLADAGVALIFAPAMKQSTFRACTLLLAPDKAVMVHSVRERSVSRFWLNLFHEIGHLILHIAQPGDTFADHEDRLADPRELAADAWARDTLVYSNALITFQARNEKPDPGQLQEFARELKIHPAIAAEVFNEKAGSEIIKYSLLKTKGLFPTLSESEADDFWRTSGFRFSM